MTLHCIKAQLITGTASPDSGSKTYIFNNNNEILI